MGLAHYAENVGDTQQNHQQFHNDANLDLESRKEDRQTAPNDVHFIKS